MIVLAEELLTTLTETFTLTLHERQQVIAVRPYIAMLGAPSGTFTMTLKSGADTLASETFTAASMKSDLSTSNNNTHLYVNLTFDDVTPLGPGTYTLVLSSSGYTYAPNSFIGWAKEYDSIYNTITGGQPTDDFDLPLKFELWSNNRNTLVWA